MLNMKFFTYKSAILIFLLLFIIKSIIFFIIKFFLNYKNTADADLYDTLATQYDILDNSVNDWPVWLNYLNHLGLYDRDIITFFLFLTSSLVLPFLIATIIEKSAVIKFYKKNRFFWHIGIIVSLYPMFLLFSFDITRDIVMMLLFCIYIYIVQIMIKEKVFVLKSIYILIILAFSIYMFEWREYLGAALLTTLIFYKFLTFKFFNFWIVTIIYLIILCIAYKLGLIDVLLLYRGENGFSNGSSTIGIGLLNKNLIEFIILYLYSMLLQLFGFYLVNIGAIILFLIESVPFIFAVVYIFKNRMKLDEFELFLLLFSLLYMTVWVIGNDNLGTAMRLRMFNYIPVLIVFGILFIKKNYIIKDSKL